MELQHDEDVVAVAAHDCLNVALFASYSLQKASAYPLHPVEQHWYALGYNHQHYVQQRALSVE